MNSKKLAHFNKEHIKIFNPETVWLFVVYESRAVCEMVNLAVLVDELIDGVGQGRQLPVEQILEANICAADVEVDVGVEDAQLLRSGGSNGDD